MRPIRLLIVDDHRVFAEGLESVFRSDPDFEPLPAVTDPDQVAEAVSVTRPDAVIMDVQLGEASGIELTAKITAEVDPPKVVVLTGYSDAATAIGAIQAGALGFVSKEGPAEHIVTAVRAAVLGGTWFPADVLGMVLSGLQGPLGEPMSQPLSQLTESEREVPKVALR